MRMTALKIVSAWRGWCGVLTPLIAVILLAAPLGAADKVDKKDAKPLVTLANEPPLLLRQKATDQPWTLAPVKDATFYAGETVLGGFGTTLDSSNGAVRLRLMGDVNGQSPFPIVETVVKLQEATEADFAFTMLRGRVDLINTKKTGSAIVKVTVQGTTAVVTLAEPGARLALEIYGRWPKGVRFKKKPASDHVPSVAVVALAIKGEVSIKGPERSVKLMAPPGPALVMLDDIHGGDPRVETLDEVPAWVQETETDASKKIKATLVKFRELATAKSITEALTQFVVSEDPAERRVGVLLMAATDDLSHLTSTMALTKNLDVWDTGVIALRSWIGRGPGQDEILYKAMVEKGKFPVGEAETVMQLLHSFSNDDLRKPETYEALIDFLESERLALRGLAYWHLSRLVPEGKKLGYNPLAPKDERAKMIKAWQELVPAGTMPGQPKAKENEKK